MFAALKSFLTKGGSLLGADRGSKSAAKSRLHFVLVQDRTGLSNNEMAKFKREMVAVIEKYFVIEDRELDIQYQRESDCTTLLINSPVHVRRVKTASERLEVSSDSEDDEAPDSDSSTTGSRTSRRSKKALAAAAS